jgi:hypothetical protein
VQHLQGNNEVTWITVAAVFLAKESNSNLNLQRLLGAIYLVGFDHLQLFSKDWSATTKFFLTECGLRFPTWMYWRVIYEATKSKDGMGTCEISMEVSKIQDQANQLASEAGRSVVSLPDLLMAIANNQDIELCRRLIAAGIDLDLISNEYGRSQGSL